ncbi:MAG: GNAT family N-acetyltransferase [Candidatus Eremiobacterota bacterium]
MKIREISEKDYPFILNLASETSVLQISPVRHGVNPDSVREKYLFEMKEVLNFIKVLADYKFLIASGSHDEPLGYLLLDTANNELVTGIPQAWIFDISVKEHCSESAVRAELLRKAEEISRGKGLRHIALRVPSTDEKSIKFFISSGYEIERKKFYKKIKEGEERKNETDGFIIRPSKTDDLPFMIKLIKENLENLISPLRNYSHEEIEKCREHFCDELDHKLKTGHMVSFVAEEEKNLLGFFLVAYHEDHLTGQGEVYVNNIIVEKSYMGKWVSNRLGKKIEEYARFRGISILSADIVMSNRRSLMFTTRYFRYEPEQVGLLKSL